jgi:hypothetical protein
MWYFCSTRYRYRYVKNKTTKNKVLLRMMACRKRNIDILSHNCKANLSGVKLSFEFFWIPQNCFFLKKFRFFVNFNFQYFFQRISCFPCQSFLILFCKNPLDSLWRISLNCLLQKIFSIFCESSNFFCRKSFGSFVIGLNWK